MDHRQTTTWMMLHCQLKLPDGMSILRVYMFITYAHIQIFDIAIYLTPI